MSTSSKGCLELEICDIDPKFFSVEAILKIDKSKSEIFIDSDLAEVVDIE
jgi:hypothetical protein